MPEREPALLRDDAGSSQATASREPVDRTAYADGGRDAAVDSRDVDVRGRDDRARAGVSAPERGGERGGEHGGSSSSARTPIGSGRDDRARGGRASTATVHVVGFWKRLSAAMIDWVIIAPVALILTWIAGALAGVHLPASRTRGLDFWLDLALSSDPALTMAFALFAAVALVYLLVFQITTGRTVGMRLLGLRVIDLYGDPPSSARCAVRTLGYLAGAATLMLGFLWIGFDSEKRGLHDWLAGTYVIRS